MEHIFYRSNPPKYGEYFGSTGTGYCSVQQECFTPINLFNVNGTMTISDGYNITAISIEDDIATIPNLIGDSIQETISVTFEEREDVNRPRYGVGADPRFRMRTFILTIGEGFKTVFTVKNGEFRTMESIPSSQGIVRPNVVKMNLSFQIGDELELVEHQPVNELLRGGIFQQPYDLPTIDLRQTN